MRDLLNLILQDWRDLWAHWTRDPSRDEYVPKPERTDERMLWYFDMK